MSIGVRRVPTVDEVRHWCQVSKEIWPDDELEAVLRGERMAQAKACGLLSLGDPPEEVDHDLYAALLRRCHRHTAARTVPLGLSGSEEFGQARIPATDAEIRRLEGREEEMVFG